MVTRTLSRCDTLARVQHATPDAARVPILNGGDGAGHHPTQTMLDLFTIQQSHGTLEGLTVILAGDLRYGRTVHSLSHALVRFGCRLIFASPELLRMPAEIVEDLREHGADVTETEDLLGNINQADVVYMTRIQKERFADEDEYAKVAGAYKLHAATSIMRNQKWSFSIHFHVLMKYIQAWTKRITLGTLSKPSMVSLLGWHSFADC